MEESTRTVDVPSEAARPARRPLSRLGIAGFALALLALLAAVLQPTVRDALRPSPKPVDQAIVEVGGRLKDRLVAKFRRDKDVPPTPTAASGPDAASRVVRLYPVGVATLSVAAIGIGAAGLIRRGDARMNGLTIAIALLALAFEQIMVAIGVTLGVVLLIWLLGALGSA